MLGNYDVPEAPRPIYIYIYVNVLHYECSHTAPAAAPRLRDFCHATTHTHTHTRARLCTDRLGPGGEGEAGCMGGWAVMGGEPNARSYWSRFRTVRGQVRVLAWMLVLVYVTPHGVVGGVVSGVLP